MLIDQRLLTMMASKKKSSFTIMVDSSGSIGKETFEIVKLCVSGLVKKLPAESFKQIINFSSIAAMVSEFKKDINELEKEIQTKLLYMDQGTYFCQALNLAKQKINILPDESDHVVIIITDGYPSDNPSQIIKELIFMGVEFFGIGVGSVSKENFQFLLPGQHILIFESYKGLCDFIDKISPSKSDPPFEYKICPTNNKIQKSTQPLCLDFVIWPSLNTNSFDANTITINILPNDYYNGFKVVVNEKVDINNPYKAKIELTVKNNAQLKTLPECIYFEVQMKNSNPYVGFFFMDFAWLSGDLTSDELVNILVEGQMGNGKSSILNLLLNLFTSSQLIDNCFLAARNTTHVTTTIDFNPVSCILSNRNEDNFLPIYQDVIDNVKIVLVDKPGMTTTDANISCYQASLGCYHPGTDSLIPKQPNELFACHSFIFVVSLATFLGEEKDIDMVKQKIIECISKSKIQPILAITFCDNYTPDELEKSKQFIYKLPVEKENVFFITPYIDDDRKRNPTKDHAGWKLLKRAFEIGKGTIEQKKMKESNSNFYKNYQPKKKSPSECPSKIDTPQYFDSPKNNVSSSYPPLSPVQIQSPVASPSPSLNPQVSNTPLPVESAKPWILSVSKDKKLLKFKVSPKVSLSDFTVQVSEKFGLTISEFNLEDEDGCILSGVSSLGDVLFDSAKLTISEN